MLYHFKLAQAAGAARSEKGAAARSIAATDELMSDIACMVPIGLKGCSVPYWHKEQ